MGVDLDSDVVDIVERQPVCTGGLDGEEDGGGKFIALIDDLRRVPHPRIGLTDLGDEYIVVRLGGWRSVGGGWRRGVG